MNIKELKDKAEQGDAKAQNDLGVLYSVEIQAYEEAVIWFKFAAKQGYPQAQYNLGLAYFSGRGIKENRQEAFNLYTKAAEGGLVQAQLELALRHSEGYYAQGIKKCPKKVEYWALKAYNNGSADAANFMGTQYAETYNVFGKDLKKAEEWWLKAEALGSVLAQYNLGMMYKNEKPVRLSQALIYLKKAADQGDSQAQCELGKLYMEGILQFETRTQTTSFEDTPPARCTVTLGAEWDDTASSDKFQGHNEYLKKNKLKENKKG